MRTTVDINDHLLREAKKKAASEGKSLRAVIEEALRALLQTPSSGRSDYKLQWRPEEGQLRPGVRLDDRQSLFDLMEER